jgi:hypothetical protein
MVRVLGILSGILMGWYAREVGTPIVDWAIGWAAALTLANLGLALREWRTRPVRVVDEAITAAILSPDPSELPQVLESVRETQRLGRPSFSTIWRYLRVSFLLNAATIGAFAILTYLMAGLLR